jgi:hypothetical protein
MMMETTPKRESYQVRVVPIHYCRRRLERPCEAKDENPDFDPLIVERM